MRRTTFVICPACDDAIPLAVFDRSSRDRRGVLFGDCAGCGGTVEMSWNGQRWDPSLCVATAAPEASARQAVPRLDVLLATLRRDRAEMRQALGSPPAELRQQTDARRRLAQSLEAYAAALTARNLPIPPPLRDELSLQTRLVAQAASGR